MTSILRVRADMGRRREMYWWGGVFAKEKVIACSE
jgi:hypothetical protein